MGKKAWGKPLAQPFARRWGDPPDGSRAAAFDWPTFLTTYGASEGWLLNETSGTTITAAVNAARNGVYTGVDLASVAGPGNLSGKSFPYWDGANDYGNILTSNGSTGLVDIFNGGEVALFFL